MSFFTLLRGKFSQDLYVQVWENRIKIQSVQGQKIYDQAPLVAIETTSGGQKVVFEVGNKCRSLDPKQYQIINPFSHPRMLLGDFMVAEKLLQFAIKELHKENFFTPAPRIIFHPMEKIEGGLNIVEEKAFRELCLGAGARSVTLHLGDELSLYDLSTGETIESHFRT